MSRHFSALSALFATLFAVFSLVTAHADTNDHKLDPALRHKIAQRTAEVLEGLEKRKHIIVHTDLGKLDDFLSKRFETMLRENSGVKKAIETSDIEVLGPIDAKALIMFLERFDLATLSLAEMEAMAKELDAYFFLPTPLVLAHKGLDAGFIEELGLESTGASSAKGTVEFNIALFLTSIETVSTVHAE